MAETDIVEGTSEGADAPLDPGNATIGIIGLGYVGLPLAVAFGKRGRVIGFDVNPERVADLSAGRDFTREVDEAALAAARHVTYTSAPADLAACSVFIVAVPTPVDAANRPDLGRLEQASETVGAVLRKGALVIYESTVYPGCTRSVCAPILARCSGLVPDRDFFVGYSPERINPGDPSRRLGDIVKVTSGSTPEAADAVDALYAAIVPAGTHKASSIEVAEAAKVIENTQRDLNIALMNELAIVFHRLGLDTKEVLQAASTKWNFLPFTPGLVGGHCIGVDPYYLTHRAQEVGYHPEIILAGRRINDRMGGHVVERVARLMMKNRLPVVGSRVLVMGLAFKENCPDVRNTRVIDIVRGLAELNADVDVWDPWVDPATAQREFGLEILTTAPQEGRYDAIILAVAHRDFADLGPAWLRARGRPGAVVFDVKSVFARHDSDGRL